MTPDTSTLSAPLEATRTTRSALQRLNGVATVGDVSAETGLSQAECEAALRALLEHHRGHLAVGERGDLVYRFDPRFLEREHAPAWVRFRERAWDAFKAVYKVSIAVVLVVYFVVFVLLAIAAILALKRGSDGDFELGGGEGHRRGGHGIGIPNFWLWYWLWSPGWGWGTPYYGEYGRRRERGKKEPGPPFWKKVFAFVFGPDRPEATRERRDRELLRLARSRGGILTAPDLVQATGMGLDEAEEELARLMAAHGGEAEATAAGVIHTFPDLMVSVDAERTARRPAPAWRRLEPDLPVTGNQLGSNLLISAINGFNLSAAVAAPWLIFPPLGISGPLAWVGLSIFPALFSGSFFAIPLLRRFRVARENRARRKRNVRRALLGRITRASLEGTKAGWISESKAIDVVREALGDGVKRVEARTRDALDRFVAEFDGEVEVGESGETRFRFPGFRAALEAASALRARARLERDVGTIVYDSGDDTVAESERDLAAFDAELASGSDRPTESGRAADEPFLLDDPDRFAFRDELELAALEQKMRLATEAKAGAGAR
ncbi:MAG: hypothetical protein RQ745_09985 [Longimicrobiales bacterium]|nr:hypothetical protein [Longimicrobiales bacterium]